MRQPNEPTPLRKARLALGLTTSEAGQYVHVTRKTWEAWEAGELMGKAAPQAKMELFASKIQNIGQNRNMGAMVTVLLRDSVSGYEQLLDVVTEENYLGLENGNVIKSMAISRDGRPYVHRTQFDPKHNLHVIQFCHEREPA